MQGDNHGLKIFDKPVINDADIIEKIPWITKGFLNRHAREMGSAGRPRWFLAHKVEAFLDYHTENSIRKKHLKERELLQGWQKINSLVDEVINKQKLLKASKNSGIIDFREEYIKYRLSQGKSTRLLEKGKNCRDAREARG